MDDATRITMLKSDLQLLTDSNDKYLQLLLKKSAEAVTREGITDPGTTDTVEYDMCIIDYAAYLFRSRASQTNTAMPTFLRFELNNLKYHQKMAADSTASESSGTTNA